MMCLRSQGRFRIRAVLLGVLIGVGIASVLVVWMNQGVYMKDHSEIVKGIILRDVG